ncbi:hypothetical protein OHC33_005090 [Knufia fluminis]|uniref:Multiple myeloma tumor-associated protein 2-like N-terminal domain-containing protein n=1 Tax=Knufia fluminis TaxID=191047 RepID=A0AAN8EU90_9EURO|nr:hypothetical protein OHC33_005090 [Knufia fluminis]
MDLLATVRKEGSRGGRGEFNWSDVQNSSRRENYLGHSLMAPVGRWSKGRDLNWYAKANGDGDDGEDPAQKAARERKEEIKRVKEAEEDALAAALGLPVPQRNNANMEPVSDKREVDKALKEASSLDHEAGKGIGFGRRGQPSEEVTETIEDEDIVMMTAKNEVIAKSVRDDITNPTETTTEEDTVIDRAKDIGIDLANAIIEDAPGQEVQITDTIDAIEIVHVHLTDHGETITNDGEMSTKVPNSRFKQPQRYP